MKSKNLNFKIINVLALVIVIFLIYQMKGLWLGIVGTIITIITPFLIGFTIAYVLYPIVKRLQDRKVPKPLAVTIVFIGLILFISLIMWLFIPNVLPVLFEQTGSLFSAILKFIQNISTKFDVNLGGIKDALSNMSDQITSGLGKTISEGALSFINQSFNILSKSLIALISSVYFLYDMESIRRGLKKYFHHKSNKNKFTVILFHCIFTS
jgi:predicted PurR-regulated permease PerM